MLSDPRRDASEAMRLSNESARFNVGPVSRNLNVPTTVLSFFHQSRLSRFEFTRKGAPIIDGSVAWEIHFKEVARPTLVMTRTHKDVPCEGTVWVVPSDGTIVRTCVQLRGFADAVAMRRVAVPGLSEVPPPPPPPQPPVQPPPPATTGQAATTSQGTPAKTAPTPPPLQPAPLPLPQGQVPTSMKTEMVRVKSLADIAVDSRRDAASGLWLPARMSELYEGPMAVAGQRTPVAGGRRPRPPTRTSGASRRRQGSSC